MNGSIFIQDPNAGAVRNDHDLERDSAGRALLFRHPLHTHPRGMLLGFWGWDFEFRVSDFGFRVSDFGFRLLGVGAGLLAFGFRVSGVGGLGLGFWEWGSGFGVWGRDAAGRALLFRHPLHSHTRDLHAPGFRCLL